MLYQKLVLPETRDEFIWNKKELDSERVFSRLERQVYLDGRLNFVEISYYRYRVEFQNNAENLPDKEKEILKNAVRSSYCAKTFLDAQKDSGKKYCTSQVCVFENNDKWDVWFNVLGQNVVPGMCCVSVDKRSGNCTLKPKPY